MTKKLQIVRVDNDLVQKANLQIGNNIIGRGVATGVSYIILIHRGTFINQFNISLIKLVNGKLYNAVNRFSHNIVINYTFIII